MTRRMFRAYLAALAALVTFSLSPFAVLGGFVVAIALFVPLMFMLSAVGVEVKGQTIDGLLMVIFTGLSAAMALTAGVFLYRAADRADKGDDDGARRVAAAGFTLLVIPIVVYYFFNALPGI
jgi:hypothetical protein